MKVTLNIKPLKEWLPGHPKPLIISGPCSAESEEQMMKTATEIAALNKVSIFRAGIWKPRTRPNSFEGMGSVALEWLSTVKKETGLLTSVEVANAGHVESALKAGVDILWIGARTTVNPFYVQEIADALTGVDIPVMVKNPIHAELMLWLGALERINRAGIQKLVAIHRGFYTFEKTIYRNAPQWEIPIELKVLCPDLPVICDPSHISGKISLLQMVSQKAIDLDMAGLMIESHINPSVALSDAAQQITPKALGELINGLTYREAKIDNQEFENRLEEFRSLIDTIDGELIEVLSRRMAIVEKIGAYKRDNNVAILQVERWIEILKTRKITGELNDLSTEFIRSMFQLIHTESIQKQTEIMNNLLEKRS